MVWLRRSLVLWEDIFWQRERNPDWPSWLLDWRKEWVWDWHDFGSQEKDSRPETRFFYSCCIDIFSRSAKHTRISLRSQILEEEWTLLCDLRLWSSLIGKNFQVWRSRKNILCFVPPFGSWFAPIGWDIYSEWGEIPLDWFQKKAIQCLFGENWSVL